MKIALTLSKYVIWLQENNRVILWNRIFGGCATVSFEQFNILSGKVINQKKIINEKIDHLRKMNILVKENIDEKRYLDKKSMQLINEAISCKKLKCLELSVSEYCNYQCVYCTFWRNKNLSEQKYISIEVAEKALRDFLNITRKQEQVIVYFGTAEPFLNWDVIVYITALARRLRPDVSLNLITNGSLVTENKLKFCKEYKINVGISLDGKPKRQREQRVPASRTIDSSNIVLELLELGARIGFKFSCLSATYRRTGFKEDIDYLISLCRKYGIGEFDLDFDTHCLGEVNLKTLIKELLYGYKIARKLNLAIFGYWLIPFLNITDNKPGLKSFCGNVVGESVCVSSGGAFKLCGYEPYSTSVYSSFKNHLKSEDFELICKSRLPGVNQYCKNCIIEGVCNGHCILIAPGDKIWLHACEFYKTVTKKLLAYHV